jgi:tetratricopeptide (TPR) repeat protein
LRIIKKVCAVVALLALSAAALVTFLRRNVSDTSNSASRLSTDPSPLSTNLSARNEYLMGEVWVRSDTKESLTKARDYFNNAVELDPRFPMAYNGLFEVYIRGNDLGLSAGEVTAKLRFYASKLMELAPDLAEAQAAQAFVDFSDGKWDRAEPEFLKAIKLNPNCAMAHNRYGFCLYTVSVRRNR